MSNKFIRFEDGESVDIDVLNKNLDIFVESINSLRPDQVRRLPIVNNPNLLDTRGDTLLGDITFVGPNAGINGINPDVLSHDVDRIRSKFQTPLLRDYSEDWDYGATIPSPKAYLYTSPPTENLAATFTAPEGKSWEKAVINFDYNLDCSGNSLDRFTPSNIERAFEGHSYYGLYDPKCDKVYGWRTVGGSEEWDQYAAVSHLYSDFEVSGKVGRIFSYEQYPPDWPSGFIQFLTGIENPPIVPVIYNAEPDAVALNYRVLRMDVNRKPSMPVFMYIPTAAASKDGNPTISNDFFDSINLASLDSDHPLRNNGYDYKYVDIDIYGFTGTAGNSDYDIQTELKYKYPFSMNIGFNRVINGDDLEIYFYFSMYNDLTAMGPITGTDFNPYPTGGLDFAFEKLTASINVQAMFL